MVVTVVPTLKKAINKLLESNIRGKMRKLFAVVEKANVERNTVNVTVEDKHVVHYVNV